MDSGNSRDKLLAKMGEREALMQELTTYFALLNNDINGEFSFTPYTSALTASLGFSKVTAYDILFFKVNRRISGGVLYAQLNKSF